MRSFSVVIPIILLLAFCSNPQKTKQLPFYNTADFTPVWLTPGDAAYKNIHTIPNFSFTNQLRQVITNKNTAGKIYVANFFFATCKNICPAMMENLAKVQNAFANDERVLILSHTVTPLRDSIPVLLKYAGAHHINSNKWWLLRGDRDATYKLARQAYFADNATGYNKSTDEFLHTENLVLIDAKGRIRGVYNSSMQLEVNNLIAHIRLLKAEN